MIFALSVGYLVYLFQTEKVVRMKGVYMKGSSKMPITPPRVHYKRFPCSNMWWNTAIILTDILLLRFSVSGSMSSNSA